MAFVSTAGQKQLGPERGTGSPSSLRCNRYRETAPGDFAAQQQRQFHAVQNRHSMAHQQDERSQLHHFTLNEGMYSFIVRKRTLTNNLMIGPLVTPCRFSINAARVQFSLRRLNYQTELFCRSMLLDSCVVAQRGTKNVDIALDFSLLYLVMRTEMQALHKMLRVVVPES